MELADAPCMRKEWKKKKSDEQNMESPKKISRHL